MRGSVFQRKGNDKKWYGVVYIKKDPKTGKWNRKNFSGDSEKEVRREVNDLIYELQNNLYADPGNMTVKDYLNDWYDSSTGTLEETTRDYYRMMLDKHIIPGLGHIKLKELVAMDIDKFYTKMKNTEYRKGKTYSGNTILKLHSIIHGALEYAKYNNYMKLNPADYVKPPKKEKFVPKIMKESNFIKLLEMTKGTFDEVAILLAGCVGLRRSEIFGLCWENIDWDNQTITIETVLTRFKSYVSKRPKNISSQRTFAVPEFVINVLSEYRKKNMHTVRVCEEFKPDPYSKHFKRILNKCGVDVVRFHDLRHFNAIIMMKYGVPDKIASGRLGHSQVATTREIYQHVLPDMDREAARIINSVFAKDLRQENPGNNSEKSS